MSLQARITLAVAATLAAAGDLATAQVPLDFTKQTRLTDGTGAGQANNMWSDTRTIAASSNETLDLSGSLQNLLGHTLAFTKVKAIVVVAHADNTNDVLVGGAASNGFISPFGDATDIVKVKPGGMFAITAPDVNGFAVTAATADQLKIANSGAGTGVTYDILIIGVE
jgi:hypothetical protein